MWAKGGLRLHRFVVVPTWGLLIATAVSCSVHRGATPVGDSPLAHKGDQAMSPIELDDSGDGQYELVLSAGTQVDGVIEAMGHEPNGYFWEAVARTVILLEAPQVLDVIELEAEGGALIVRGENSDALAPFTKVMQEATTDEKVIRSLVMKAPKLGVEFDD